MKLFSMTISLIVTLVFSVSAQASLFSKYGRYANDKDAYLWLNLGFANAAINIGGEYEHILTEGFGVGGLLKNYSEGKTQGSGDGPKGFLIGGFVKPHVAIKSFDIFVAPGLGMLNIDWNGESESVLAGFFTTGMMMVVNEKVSFGVDTTTVHGLTSDKAPGAFLVDYNFKVRFSM